MKQQLSMTERVHPEAPLFPYPSVQSDGNQHENHMPNGVMQKDQEKGTRGLANNDQGYSQGAQMAMEPRRRRRRRCFLRCCCCIGACVGTFLLIVGILVLVFFLVLHPKLPKYTVTEASISNFTMSNSSSTIANAIVAVEGENEGTVYLNVDMELMVRMRNPNKKIGIDYRGINGKLLYEGVEIGAGSIPAFYQGHKNTTYVGLAMQGRDIALTPSLASTLRNTLKNEDSIVLHARAIALVRIKIGSWKTHTSKVRVKCTVQVSNPTRGSVRLLHDSCNFKLLRLRL